MIVCSCNVLSDRAIRACLKSGRECPRTPAQVYRSLGCGPKCGRCAVTIRSIISHSLANAIPALLLAPAPGPVNRAAEGFVPGGGRYRQGSVDAPAIFFRNALPSGLQKASGV